MSKSYTVIHLHIPRTGGSSCYQVLSQMTHDPGRKIRSNNVEVIQHRLTQNSALPLLISGHIPFGLHHLCENPIYFIILRDPTFRVWSFIKYVRSRPRHNSYLDFMSSQDNLMNIFDFSASTQLRNGMVRQLNIDFPTSVIGEAEFELAWDVLNRPDVVVGFDDDLDAAFARLGDRIGFSFSTVPKLNCTAPDMVKSNLQALIEQHNLFDRRLHTKAAAEWG